LLVNGSLDAASAVTVNTSGTLGGSGTIGGSVTVNNGGSVAPGASAGTLSIGGNLTISGLATGSPTGKLVYELGPIAASDKIAVTGTLTIGTGLLGFSNIGGLQAGTYKLITSGGISGTLNSGDLTGAIGSFNGTLQITGNDLELVLAPANTAPVANARTFSVPQYGTVTIAIGSGAKALATDDDNDPLTFVSLGNPNGLDYGSTVINSGNTNFTYTNTSGSPLDQDVFSFIVTDGIAFATNLITIQIGSPVGANLVSATYTNPVGYLTFAGIPGTNYVLEHTATLSYPITWTPVQTNQANTSPPIGYIYFQQTLSPSNDYFRTRAQ
jgi:hypothetical protein